MTEHSEQSTGKHPQRPESNRDAPGGRAPRPSGTRESSRPDGAEGVELESASEDTVKLKSREHPGESQQHTQTRQNPHGKDDPGRHSER